MGSAGAGVTEVDPAGLSSFLDDNAAEVGGIVIDLSAGGSDSGRMVADVVERARGLPVIALTSLGADDVAVAALDGGARDVVEFGPTGVDALRRAVVLAAHRGGDREALARARAELRERRRLASRHNTQIFDRSPSGMATVGPAGEITQANDRFCRILGHEARSLDGMRLTECVDHDVAIEVLRSINAVLSGAADEAEHELLMRRADDSVVLCHAGVSPIERSESTYPQALLQIEDVTQARVDQIEWSNRQRLSELGGVAAGLAHELRTPLQYVGSNVEFIGEELGRLASLCPPDGDAARVIAQMQGAVEDAVMGVRQLGEIVQSMTVLAHPGENRFERVDLNEHLGFPMTLVRGQATNDTRMEASLLSDLPPVWCNPGLIRQVLLNLLVNAVHAIQDRPPGSPTGEIFVRTDVDGGEVRVEVADNGTGIADDDLPRVFEPFFTTKDVGRGTGQGLAVVREVVEVSHGGRIHVESEVGMGTTFTIWLPINGVDGEVPELPVDALGRGERAEAAL